jgi:fluoride ion exporter CrcB/FEX
LSSLETPSRGSSPIRSEFVLVFMGGGLGSLARYLIGSGLEVTLGSAMAGMYSLFFVNVAGAFFLGLVSFHPYFANDKRKAFWGSGFAGGFTTMSGVALFVYQQSSVTITTVMFAFGFFAFAAGVAWGKKKAGVNELG